MTIKMGMLLQTNVPIETNGLYLRWLMMLFSILFFVDFY